MNLDIKLTEPVTYFKIECTQWYMVNRDILPVMYSAEIRRVYAKMICNRDLFKFYKRGLAKKQMSYAANTN